MIQKGKTMIQNSRLEDKESLLNRDFIEKRKEVLLLTLFFMPLLNYYNKGSFTSILQLLSLQELFASK